MQLLSEEALDAFAHNGFVIVKDFLEVNVAKALLQDVKIHQEAEAFKQAGIGNASKLSIQETYRSDQIKWIEKTGNAAATQHYVDCLSALQEQCKQAFYLPLKDFECMFAIYPEGAFYKKHTDRFAQQAHRLISVVLYLNENWQESDGGELMLYTEEKIQTIQPKFNTLVCFKSELWHEVLPCTKERYSVTAWLKDQLNELTFL
jgi:SM-20-related protein